MDVKNRVYMFTVIKYIKDITKNMPDMETNKETSFKK